MFVRGALLNFGDGWKESCFFRTRWTLSYPLETRLHCLVSRIFPPLLRREGWDETEAVIIDDSPDVSPSPQNISFEGMLWGEDENETVEIRSKGCSLQPRPSFWRRAGHQFFENWIMIFLPKGEREWDVVDFILFLEWMVSCLTPWFFPLRREE